MTDQLFKRGFEVPAFHPQTFDEATQSVRVVAVTEDPVRIWDGERADFVEEVLLIDGVVLPPSGKVPLLDSHNRESVSHVLGSARRFVARADALECEVFFSSTDSGRNAARNVKEGHLSDFSVGYLAAESVFVPPGQQRDIMGRRFTGPLKITSRWHLRELSVTPIGADQRAKARSASDAPMPRVPGPAPGGEPMATPAVAPAAGPVIELPAAPPSPPPDIPPPVMPAPVAPPPEAPAPSAAPESPVMEARSEAAVTDPPPDADDATRSAPPPPPAKPAASGQGGIGAMLKPKTLLDKIFYAFFMLMLLSLLIGLLI